MLITNQIIKQANAICFKIKKTCLCLNNIKSIVILCESNNQESECNLFVATTMVHVFIYTVYTIHLPTNRASESNLFLMSKTCIDLIFLTVNNVSLKLGTWVGGKALLAKSLHLTWEHLSP